jgi:hypothetical protein
MNISISYQANDFVLFEEVKGASRQIPNVQAYPVDLLGSLGPKNVFDPDMLYEELRYPDIAIVILSPEYLADPWFLHELPALFMLERHFNLNIILPVLAGNLDDSQIPAYLQDRQAIDLRGNSHQDGLLQLQEFIKQRLNTRISREVFIVHGHDEVREAVARFIERLDLDPIILAEQPNSGKTIIEKLEDYQDVAFALVLLTPDDVGGKDSANLKHRARQNVILELGFFMGALGRSKVCALYKGSIEMPSDYSGVIFISLDQADWRVKVAKELKKSGFAVDINKAVLS